MEQLARKPILELEMTVKTNISTRKADKPDVFGVSMKNDPGTLIVGMQEATATLTIKGGSDVLHFDFPKEDEFVVKIYPKRRSEPQPIDRTQQTNFFETLTEEIPKQIPGAEVLSVHHPAPDAEPLQEQSAFADVPEMHEESPEEPLTEEEPIAEPTA